MSRSVAFAKGLDEDDLLVLRRRLERLLVAVRDWEIILVNDHEYHTRIEKDGERPVRVQIDHTEKSITMRMTDPWRRTDFSFTDHTVGVAEGLFGRPERITVVEKWIGLVDAAFGFGVHENRMSAWSREIDEARTLCAAIVGSTGHRFCATLEMAGGDRGFTLGQSDTGIEGGILLDHVNERIATMIPSLVVIEHDAGGGGARYSINSCRDLPDDVTIDIDPDEWPDALSCLRILSRMDGVPKPWTCIQEPQNDEPGPAR